MKQKLIILIIAIPLIVILAILLGPRPDVVELGSVEKGPMKVMVESEGRTQIKNIYSISAPVSGRLLRTQLKAGDAVIAGKTILAQIEPPTPNNLDSRTIIELKAKVKSSTALCELARAEVIQATAALDFSQADLKRNKKLIALNFLSQQALEQSQLELRTKKAELEVAKKNLKSRESELEMDQASLLPLKPSDQQSKNTEVIKIMAQTNGKVLQVLQESEISIEKGAPIIEVGDPADLEVLLEMLSENAAKVLTGKEALLSGWGGKVLHGQVRRIEPYGFIKVSALGIEEQRVNVLVDFVDPIDDWNILAHGYRVDAQIVVWERENVLKVPMGALFRDKNNWAVFLLTADGTVEQRQITIGHSSDIEAEVIKGLAENDRVVLHPSDQIQPGVPVVESSE